jgi:hypothetical protein
VGEGLGKHGWLQQPERDSEEWQRRAHRTGLVRHQDARGIAGEASFPLRQGFGELGVESGLTPQRITG